MLHMLTVVCFSFISIVNMAWSGMLIAWLREPNKNQLLQNAFGQSAAYLQDVVNPIMVTMSLSMSIVLALAFGFVAILCIRDKDQPDNAFKLV